MKKIFILLIALMCGLHGFANHITGGTIFYTFQGVNNGLYTYNVTLLLYRDHGAPAGSAQLEAFAPISIFNKQTGATVWDQDISLADTFHLFLGSPDPCIDQPPVIWYEVGRYSFTVSLPSSAAGYIITYQRCCRIAGINNLVGSNSVGATYTAEIPGTNTFTTPAAPENNSARFLGRDTVIVCANNNFCYDFGASDLDGDSLAYYFCNAYTSQQNPPNPNPPAPPPYGSVPYASPFNQQTPLGDGVTINSGTGMMCGIAPPPGVYVVTVCVSEYRDGILIATQRKDLQIKVGDCDIVDAALPVSFPICDDFTRTFENQAPANPLVHTYRWSFGDPASGANNISSLATPTHTFSDTGIYQIKLVVNPGDNCADSATAIAYVYPGFFPNFYFQGICVNKPTQFFDSSRTVYGFINSWSWDFGNTAVLNDTSHLQNPVYTYNTTGLHNIRFIVTSNKGCIDTVYKNVVVMDKPLLQAVPKDTLICNGAQVVLNAVGIGAYTWTGPGPILNPNTPNPTVSPTITSNYIVELNDNGCINHDTMTVRVVDFVTLNAMADTVICATDSLVLTGQSNGLHYTWAPSATIASPTKLTTGALPVASITYTITARIDHCIATDNVNVTLVPYPVANAGPDTTICFSSAAQLHASIVGNSFTWSPTNTLSNPAILDPVATPFATTRYVLTVFDIQGCPKPKRDTVVVNVLPKILPFAGNDTAVVVGQPLQFNATGGVDYEWSPPTGLNNINIRNPIGHYDGSFDSIIYKVIIRNEFACADSDYVTVRIFKTSPQIFVPTAFTPNGDGRNDVFRPIAVGISKFDYFRVYNRWGQLVFETRMVGYGWDGRIGGKEQGSNTFVWVVKGTDYTGKQVFEKGTVTLIR